MTAVPFRGTVLFPNPHSGPGGVRGYPDFHFNIVPEQAKLKLQKIESYDFTVNLIRYDIVKTGNLLYNI